MRKRNIVKIADTIFWYAIYMLPLILTIIQSIGFFANFGFDAWVSMYEQGLTPADFEFMHILNQNLAALGCESGLIVEALYSIFGEYSEILPLFNGAVIFATAQWFVGTVLVHLCVDFILAIPRIAHKWLDDFAKGE